MVVDGIYYALVLSAGGAVVWWLAGAGFGAPLFVLALFCLYFFRDPERAIPDGPVAVSPADGKVVAIKPASPATTRISIFLNIFDVHVNRAPIAGKITAVKYHKGEFLVASREAASSQNEQNTVTVEGDGTRVTFRGDSRPVGPFKLVPFLMDRIGQRNWDRRLRLTKATLEAVGDSLGSEFERLSSHRTFTPSSSVPEGRPRRRLVVGRGSVGTGMS